MGSVKRVFDTVAKYIYKIASALVIISLTLLCAMIIVQVVLRYVFHAPLFGIEEAEMFPILWIYALGGCIASFEKTHIECGVAGVIVKNKKAVKIIERVKYLVSFGLSLFACYMLYPHFTYIWKVRKTTVTLGFPTVFCESFIFLGLAVMAFLSLRDLVDSIAGDDETEGGSK